MSDVLDYDVVQEVRGATYPGRLRLQSDKIAFRNTKTGRTEQINPNDIEQVNWLLRAKGNCLKLSLKTGNAHRFDGFKDVDFDKLASFIKSSYHHTLEKTDMALKGWNWGAAKFKANSLQFEVDHKPAFEVPLNYVSHSTTGKNEVTIEFHINDDAAVSLTELRFHIPSDVNPDKDPVSDFHKNVMQNADVLQVTGNALTTFSQVYCLTPRGRYDIKIFPSFLQLHGKTFDYKISYTSILRLFLLPHRDGRQTYFVISLDPPIKQGQTRYHFLILLFNKDDEISLELAMSQKQLDEKYEGKLQTEMQGPEFELISKVMKALVNQKITVPGSFVGHSGTQAIACSYRASTGFLYPLERGFIFVHKPPLHIRFDEVTSVNFARSAGGSLTRSFDFDVETKSGTVFNFVGIEKDEYGKLFDFVKQKKLRVKNIGDKVDGGGGKGNMSGSDDEPDAYLEQVKREARERDEDDEDEEDDEDFAPPASGSEVDEEFDSNAGSASSEGEGEDGEPSEKKKKKHTAKTKTKEPGTRKKAKDKKERDPDQPKRPASAYILWFNENRERIKKDHPSLSITEIGKKAGELWRALADKSKWENEVKKQKAAYDEAMAEYKANLGDKPKTSSKPSKAKASPKKDARPSTGVFKSKEFISDSSDSDKDSDEDKPKKKDEKPKKSAAPKSTEPARGRSKRGKAQEEELMELPSDEEILSSPEHSGASNAPSEEESVESAAGSEDEDD